MKTTSNWPHLAVVLSLLAFLPLVFVCWRLHATASALYLAVWLVCMVSVPPWSRHSAAVESKRSDSAIIGDVSLALATVSSASEEIWGPGPQGGLDDVRKAIVTATERALGADHVALITIDPCIASLVTECSDDLSEAVKDAFLDLYDIHQTGRDLREAWALEGIVAGPESQPESYRALRDAGVQSVLACSIRSEVSASGALVAFFSSASTVTAIRRQVISLLATEASAALAYALSTEQSRELMDGLAGANVELSFQATSDGLTGLANHRTFQQKISGLCRKAASSMRVFSLMMVDVDHFKIYNDCHGHREGDAVLQRVARILSSRLRQGDLAARYGGEEFAIIFRGTDKDAAYAAADRIRRRIAEESFPKGTVTVSMGLAEFPADGSSPGELIENADKALYHAKLTGRNRVFVWGRAPGSDPVHSDSAAGERAQRCVLVVEDPHDEAAGTLADTLGTLNYRVDTASGANEAAELMKTRAFDIALVSRSALADQDVRLLGSLAEIHPDMPIVLVVSDVAVADSREAMRRGATDVLVRPFNEVELPIVIERNLELRRLELQRTMRKSTGMLLQAIDALVAAIEARDRYTAGHSDRVTALSLAISERLNLSNEERYALELAAKLHDVGKIGLPDSSLNKESPLTEEEWSAMREHPALGSRIVGAIDELAYVSTIIRHHHERLDGTGYPDGLRGPTIPLLSRIIAVADSYEAMTSERAHRSRLTPSEALEELEFRAGTHYSPDIVSVLRSQLAAQGEVVDPIELDSAA